MASTYINDLRLNEMATGDGSGTWGTTTNTNLELIAEAFSYGTEVITTNADTHTTTIADGATDPGRSLYLKYTGTLDSACTITIGPNTVSKVWIIENGTSGSQDIILSQGSGANITIPAGDTKVVYSDGAGAGAAFVDAFANLKVTDPAQTNITSVGTLTGFTSTGIDDNADATAITIDSSENVGIGTSSPNQKLNVSGGRSYFGANNEAYAIGVGYNGTRTAANQTYFIGATDATTPDLQFSNSDGGEKVRITHAGNVGIGTTSPAAPLDVLGSDVFSIRSLRNTGNGGLSNTDTAGGIRLGTSNGTTGYVGAAIDIQAPTTWVAGSSQPTDLRFFTVPDSSTTLTERLRIDSSGNVGIGTTNNYGKLSVYNALGSSAGINHDPGVGTYPRCSGIGFGATSTSYSVSSGGGTVSFTGGAGLYAENTAASGNPTNLVFWTNASGSPSEAMRIDSSGNVGIGTTSPSSALDVVGDIEVSGGVYLGGTVAANLLDDYEEGTWTPTYGGTSTNGSIAYTNQYGYYTKIGNIVTVNCRLSASTVTTSPTGNMVIRGLPFTVSSATDNYHGANIGYSNSWATAPAGGHSEPSNTFIYLKVEDANGNLNGNISSIADSYDIVLSITYQAA
jgi:hypothetical protein